MTQQEKPQLKPEHIDINAYNIVSALQKNGFTTYLVGGCVRDLMLGIEPKDFDIVTNAKPNEIRKSVSQAYIIGKRFRLVLVKRGFQQFEVSTFRREFGVEDEAAVPEGEIPDADNLFGSPEQDAKRRDFTINGMFYDPVKNEMIDFTEGVSDLRSGVIRMIGEPEQRLIEDPIRIMRALRLSHKIRFKLDTDLLLAMRQRGGELARSVLPRRREEILKFLRLDEPHLVFLDAYDLGLLGHISPTMQRIFDSSEEHEEFVTYLRNFHGFLINRENPVELYAVIVLAVIRALIEKSPYIPLRSKELMENPVLQKFMKDELGMFNHEQTLVTKAIQLQSLIAKPDEVLRKGERRQNALFAMEAFPLAMQIAKRDYLVSGEVFMEWALRFHKYSGDRPTDTVATPKRKKRRRFRGKRREAQPAK